MTPKQRIEISNNSDSIMKNINNYIISTCISIIFSIVDYIDKCRKNLKP